MNLTTYLASARASGIGRCIPSRRLQPPLPLPLLLLLLLLLQLLLLLLLLLLSPPSDTTVCCVKGSRRRRRTCPWSASVSLLSDSAVLLPQTWAAAAAAEVARSAGSSLR